MEVEEIPRKRQTVPSVLGRATYDGVIAGRVSGRNWKQPRKHRSSAAKAKSLEQRMKEKETKKAYKERINELKEETRQSKVEKRKQREEREKKKEENILKSGTKVQKITKRCGINEKDSVSPLHAKMWDNGQSMNWVKMM